MKTTLEQIKGKTTVVRTYNGIAIQNDSTHFNIVDNKIIGEQPLSRRKYGFSISHGDEVLFISEKIEVNEVLSDYLNKINEHKMILESPEYNDLIKNNSRQYNRIKILEKKLAKIFIENTKITKKQILECIRLSDMNFNLSYCHPDHFNDYEKVMNEISYKKISNKTIMENIPTVQNMIDIFGSEVWEDWTIEELIQNISSETMTNIYQNILYSFSDKYHIPESASCVSNLKF